MVACRNVLGNLDVAQDGAVPSLRLRIAFLRSNRCPPSTASRYRSVPHRQATPHGNVPLRAGPMRRTLLPPTQSETSACETPTGRRPNCTALAERIAGRECPGKWRESDLHIATGRAAPDSDSVWRFSSSVFFGV